MQRYDVPTAVTFLFAGLGLGAVLAVLFAPRPEHPEEQNIEGKRMAGERIDGVRIFDPELPVLEHGEEAFTSRAV